MCYLCAPEAPDSRPLLEVDAGMNVASLRPRRSWRESGIGSLLVSEGHRLLGIFTERDVLTRVVGRGLDPDRTPVGEVMTRRLVTVTPETTIEEAMAMITEHRCRHLPVVAGEKVVGLVSSGDLTRWLVRDQLAEIHDLVDYIRSS